MPDKPKDKTKDSVKSSPDSKEKEASGRERRKHSRIHTRIEIPYWKYVKFRKKDEVNIGFVKNMSKGGVFIETEEVFEVGSDLAFEFYLPNSSEAIRGIGQIKWVKTAAQIKQDVEPEFNVPGMGIQFVKFDGNSEAILDEFIQKELYKR